MPGRCSIFLGTLLTVSLVAFQAAETPKPGRIEGRVIDASSGEPLKKAFVILRHSDEAGAGALTDPEGKFALDDVKPAAYTITAERDGFILHPDSEKTVVTVTPGETQPRITLKMLRTGAISGRVLDADGEPVVGAGVHLRSVRETKGRPVVAFGASTNDRGEYRAFSIAPGKYRLAASHTPRSVHLEVRLRDSEVSATTYYPGTLDARQGSVIEIKADADLHGYDIRLLRRRGVRVRGKVIGPGGAPAGPFVLIGIQSDPMQIGVGEHRSAIARGANGEFELAQVLPGKYVITAQAGLSENQREHARKSLEVSDADVDGIVLTLAKPQKITGRVLVPEGRSVPQGLIVMLGQRERLDSQAGGVGEVSREGTFRLESVVPGDYDVLIGSTIRGDDLYVNAIRMGDLDVLAEGLQVPGAGGSIEIVLKANGGLIECSVAGKDSKPMPGAHVMLIPDPPRRTQPALSGSCNTDASGTCTVVGITPGEYHLFAFTKEQGIDVRDAEVMKDLEKHGKPVKIAEGDQQKIELTVVPDDN
jgi:protocatechuate 3,4-dioxygenase beta subunit